MLSEAFHVLREQLRRRWAEPSTMRAIEDEESWRCSERVIAACIEVHRALGPGLLESAYEQCLAHELGLRGVGHARQIDVPVVYKGIELERGYRADFVIEGMLVLEVKTVEQLLPIHEAQLLTYLRLLRVPAGLLVNFLAPTLKHSIRRLSLTPRPAANSWNGAPNKGRPQNLRLPPISPPPRLPVKSQRP
jgi:GxxExxY protein